ncbi:MAG: hypothetical protein J6D36_03505 [Erysipelotrichaceae bacterium]|nr:hypothetical protein [Erysipelotrichaceae bacterium]
MSSNGSSTDLYPKRNQDGLSDAGKPVRDLTKKAIANEKTLNNLSKANIAAINRGENCINDHVLEKDVSAVQIESSGGVIAKKDGSPYNHIQEAKGTMKGLQKSIKSLENTLKNPNLDKDTRDYLEHEMKRFQLYYSILEDAFKGGKKK